MNRNLWAGLLPGPIAMHRALLKASASSSVSCLIGDAVCQGASDKADWDVPRLAAFSTTGFVMLGPIGLGILTTASTLLPGTGTGSLVGRIGMIALLEPIRLGGFLGTNAVVQQAFHGQTPISFELAKDEMQAKTAPSVLRSLFVFPPFLFIAFKYLKPENRIPLLSLVGTCWNSYMSLVASRKVDEKQNA